MTEHVDVLIIGAGLSGIGTAWHLQDRCPWASYAILEGRGAIGGTWDLFRYPGIRSDSDMYTLGYRFRPWTEAKAIADGPAILNYVRETAREGGIDRHIRFNHRVIRAEWSSTDARWTVDALVGDELRQITCGYLHAATGYYAYDQGYRPEFPAEETFAGPIIHPQHWPEDLDYAGKRVVVIGSGATAVTLVPEMARTAAHVTMLQRSPTYVVSRPAEDGFANWLRRNLPGKLAYAVARWRMVLMGMFFYQMTRWRPARVKKQILDLATAELGPEAVAKHFTPTYNPWDQRLCLVPDADLFASLRAGTSSVVTGHIARFDARGIALTTGEHVPADIIVTATGLTMKMLHNVELLVDGVVTTPASSLNYKGMMFSDLPNLSATFGYTNASWTLKADLVAEYICRLLNQMRDKGYVSAVPRRTDASVVDEPFLSFSSGYVQRALAELPRQGSKRPWKVYQNYLFDLVTLRFGRVDDGTLEFRRAGAPVAGKAKASEPA